MTSSCSTAAAIAASARLGRPRRARRARWSRSRASSATEQVAHRGAEGAGGAGRQQAAAGACAVVAAPGGAVAASGARSTLAERPAVQRGRRVDGDLPLEPHRHPRLRPHGHAQGVWLGALEQRVVGGWSSTSRDRGRVAQLASEHTDRAAVVHAPSVAEAKRRLARRGAARSTPCGNPSPRPRRRPATPRWNGRADQRLLGEQRAPRRVRRRCRASEAGRRRRSALPSTLGLVRPAAPQQPVGGEPAVVAVAQAATSAAHGDERIEREVEARRRLRRPGAARR